MSTPLRAEVPSEERVVIRLTPLEFKLLARMAGVQLDAQGRVKRASTYSEPTLASYIRECIGLLPKR